MIGEFAHSEEGEMPLCFGTSEWTGEQFSIAIWGDDATTPEMDGYQEGDSIFLSYQLLDGSIMGLMNYEALTFVSNGIIDNSSLFENNGFITPNLTELIKTNFQKVGVNHSKFNTCL